MNQPDRYQARYRDGYYVVIDTTTGEVVPPEANHYSRHKDGYLWDHAAAFAARDLNAATRPPQDRSARRRELCESMVTLNGRPATISGTRLPFAHVRQHPDGLEAEWSWDAVARIVAAGGAFRK